MSDLLDREIRLAFWKILILHHAAKGEVYGMKLLQQLEDHGCRLSPGTLYPALARMVASGWLLRVDDSEEPKIRRPYRISPQGRRVLQQIQRDVAALHREVVLGEEASGGAVIEPSCLDGKRRLE